MAVFTMARDWITFCMVGLLLWALVDITAHKVRAAIKRK